MSRSTNSPASHRRKKRLLKEAKGFMWSRNNKFRLAKEALLKAWKYSYRDRKKRKKEKRRLWNVQLNAALRQEGKTYSRFQQALRKNKIELNRKVLVQIAQGYPETFKKVVQDVFENVTRKS